MEEVSGLDFSGWRDLGFKPEGFLQFKLEALEDECLWGLDPLVLMKIFRRPNPLLNEEALVRGILWFKVVKDFKRPQYHGFPS